MGWIQIVEGPPKGWWNSRKMLVFLAGTGILGFGVWMSLAGSLPGWLIVPIVLLFLVLCLLTSTSHQPTKRWDTKLNTYIDYDSNDGDSMSDCGD